MTTDTTPAAGSKPYAAPDFTEFGSISGLTAGPDAGTLDQLIGNGSDGGFLDPDPTS